MKAMLLAAILGGLSLLMLVLYYDRLKFYKAWADDANREVRE